MFHRVDFLRKLTLVDCPTQVGSERINRVVFNEYLSSGYLASCFFHICLKSPAMQCKSSRRASADTCHYLKSFLKEQHGLGQSFLKLVFGFNISFKAKQILYGCQKISVWWREIEGAYDSNWTRLPPLMTYNTWSPLSLGCSCGSHRYITGGYEGVCHHTSSTPQSHHSPPITSSWLDCLVLYVRRCRPISNSVTGYSLSGQWKVSVPLVVVITIISIFRLWLSSEVRTWGPFLHLTVELKRTPWLVGSKPLSCTSTRVIGDVENKKIFNSVGIRTHDRTHDRLKHSGWN